MIDLLSRVALIGGTLIVMGRAWYVRRYDILDRRSLVLSWVFHGLIPGLVFWVSLVVTRPVVSGPLVWEVWLSRLAFGSLLVVLWQVVSVIADEEQV